jgi:hypothetical protein
MIGTTNMQFKPMNLFTPLAPETCRLLDKIPTLIDKVFPLPERFRSALPSDIAELSRLLTSGRGERSLSYLGRPPMLSAYLRFFLPWNLYRLCRLLPSLQLSLTADDRITDHGCGPLTFASALWISRPELRSIPLEFHCVDRSGPALDAGKKFFAALTAASKTEDSPSKEGGENCPWKIHTVKGDFTTIKAKSAALVCAINVFNEMYGDISRNGPDNIQHEKFARLLENHASATSEILVVEPGFPRCGEFISRLRNVFLERGRSLLSPCPHNKPCPFPGGGGRSGKNRWCHFAFDTEDAPSALHRLSRAAGLPKERAVMSFLFAGPTRALSAPKPECTELPLRVISDAFPLPKRTLNRYGRYGCSEQGLVLLAGEKNSIENINSGALVNVTIKNERDSKSGALIAELTQMNIK